MYCRAENVGATIRTYSIAVGHTSLEILNAVTETIDALVAEQDDLRHLLITASDHIECVAQCGSDITLDETGKSAFFLEKAENIIADVCQEYEQRIVSAQKDKALKGDHEDGVVTEYRNTIGLLEELHSVTADLRWAIMQHDAEQSPVTGSFTEPEALVAHLKSL